MSDKVLNDWAEVTAVETQQAVVDEYAETGVINYEAAGVDEVEAAIVQTAFTNHLERNVLKQYGLSYEQWNEHIAEADLPAFRMACVKGDWALIHDHAQKCAQLRKELGI